MMSTQECEPQGLLDGNLSGVSRFLFCSLASYVVFLSTATVLTLFLSVVRIPITQLPAIGIVVVAAGSGVFYGRALSRRLQADLMPESAVSQSRGLWWLLGAGLAVYGLLWVMAWAKPDFSFDGNYYHIPAIHFWVRQARVYWIGPMSTPDEWYSNPLWFINGYPKGAEVIAFLFVQCTGAPDAVNGLNLMFLPVGLMGVALLAQLLGAGPRLACLAAILYMLVPVNIAQASTTYVDSANGACFVAVLALLAVNRLAWRRRTVPWILVPALGGASGLVMSIKGTGPLMLAIILVFLGLQTWPGIRSYRTWLPRVAYLLLVGAAAVGVGGYWTIRNIWIGKSPIYPAEVRIAGHVLFPGKPFVFNSNLYWNTPAEMRPWSRPKQIAYTWLQGMSYTNWLNSLPDFAARRGGLGFTWPIGSLPALLGLLIYAVVAYIRKHRPREGVPLLLPYLFAFAAIVFLCTPGAWWPKYVVWIQGLGLPCLVVAVTQMLARPRLRWIASGWLAVCLIFAIGESGYALSRVAQRNAYTAFVSYHPLWTSGGWRTPLRTLRAINQDDNIYGEWGAARGTLLGDALSNNSAPVSLYSVTGQRYPMLGRLGQPVGLRSIAFMSAQEAKDPRELDRHLRENKTRYVICDDDSGPWLELRRRATRFENVTRCRLAVFEIADQALTSAAVKPLKAPKSEGEAVPSSDGKR